MEGTVDAHSRRLFAVVAPQPLPLSLAWSNVLSRAAAAAAAPLFPFPPLSVSFLIPSSLPPRVFRSGTPETVANTPPRLTTLSLPPPPRCCCCSPRPPVVAATAAEPEQPPPLPSFNPSAGEDTDPGPPLAETPPLPGVSTPSQSASHGCDSACSTLRRREGLGTSRDTRRFLASAGIIGGNSHNGGTGGDVWGGVLPDGAPCCCW